MGLISASGTVSGVAQRTVQVNGDFANFCLHNASRTSPNKSPLGSLPAGQRTKRCWQTSRGGAQQGGGGGVRFASGLNCGTTAVPIDVGLAIVPGHVLPSVGFEPTLDGFRVRAGAQRRCHCGQPSLPIAVTSHIDGRRRLAQRWNYLAQR